MKTQITKLENEVLKGIQKFTSEDFGSDSAAWANVHEISETIEPKKLRALISTLSQKGILIHVSDEGLADGPYVEVKNKYFTLTGNHTEAGSPEFEYINLKVK